MASIQKAALKPPKQRKAHDRLRMQAGHMLTFDYLVQHDFAERHVAMRVVRKSIERAVSCVTLPLTVLYFGAYVTAARLHEDITNVYLQEKTMRSRVDNIFQNVLSVEDWWDALMSPEQGMFLDVFFKQKDAYGNTLAKNNTANQWGDWGMVEGYSQIQGAVRFLQWRASDAKFNDLKYNCTNRPDGQPCDLCCTLCEDNIGFQTEGTRDVEPPIPVSCGRNLTSASSSPRRMGDILQMGNEALTDMKSSLMKKVMSDEDQGFVFWLFPSDSRERTLQRLQYFRDRNWIDPSTYQVEIKMYLMNAELGRNRLEQLEINFYVSEAGSVLFQRELQAVFLTFYQSSLAKAADLLFFVILIVTSLFRCWEIWKAFLGRKLFEHIFQLYTAWEWLMILVGWWTILGFYKMWFVWEEDITNKLRAVHNTGMRWDLGDESVDRVKALFTATSTAADGYASLRVVFSQYSVVLMFRFFVSFGSQPRLAIVLNTMINVLTDFFHFLIVFLPVFLAYVISGSLLFGRRLKSFSTVQYSAGMCLRFALESQYHWEDLAAEDYWAAALWAWSYLLVVVVLFLNVVIAIILDIYNETLEASFLGEPIWQTMGNLMSKSVHMRKWVPDRTFQLKLQEGDLSKESLITEKALAASLPDMPEQQKIQFFKACREEMKFEAVADVSKRNFLRLSNSVMEQLDLSSKVLNRVVTEEAKDPLKPWVTPVAPHTLVGDKVEVHTDQNFLSRPVITKGRKEPPLQKPTREVCDTYSESGPPWLKEIWTMLQQQRDFINLANENLGLMHTQIQEAHKAAMLQNPQQELRHHVW